MLKAVYIHSSAPLRVSRNGMIESVEFTALASKPKKASVPLRETRSGASKTPILWSLHCTFLCRMKYKRGYDVVMLFICLESDEDCIKRVQTRVSIGGHNVPAEIIKHRYAKGLSLLKSHILQLTSCYLFDNSAQTLRLIASTEGRRILWQTESMPQWATRVLSTIALLNK